jgi:hypothetical protein
MNIFIAFLMLFVPGLISVRIHGITKIARDNWQGALFAYLVYSFTIVLCVYGFMFLTFPQRAVSFSLSAGDIYSASFVFKYSLVALIFSLVLPKLRARWLNRDKTQRLKIENDE